MIVDLLSKEHQHKQDEPDLDIVRNDQWTRVSSNHQKKPKSIGEESTCYTPSTINHYELLTSQRTQTSAGQKRIMSYVTTQDACKGNLFTKKTSLWVNIK